jgi:hypothetical protein
MRFPGFIGPAYQARSLNVDAQRCVNLYLEMDEIGTGKEHEPAALVGTPGLSLLLTLPTLPIRGLYRSSADQLYAVGGSVLYLISVNGSGNWQYSSVGSLLTSTGTVSMADNGIDLMLVDGANGYSTALGSVGLTIVTDPLWEGANQVIFADGFFIFNKPNTFEFYFSQSESVSLIQGGLGLLSKNTPDPLVGMCWDHRSLWLFGEEETEIWYNAGAAVDGTPGAAPFQIVQGTYLQVGCAATFSIQQLANTIFWVGRDKNGEGAVYMAQGYAPQRISTFPIEYAISTYGDISATTSWTYQESGHSFYCLNFPNANTTWCYDATTGNWHERTYLNNGVQQRHLVENHAFAMNTHVVGDYSSGNLYSLSDSVYTDNGSPLVSKRTAPHLAEDMNRIFHAKFQLDFEPGVGLDGFGQGTTPAVVLRFSDDGGHSWSNEKWGTLGAIGQTKWRAFWRRLGESRDRVYEITITDPVKRILIGAELELIGGAS